MAISQATLADVTGRALRTLSATETTWATVRLRDAFTQIIATLPDVATRLDAGILTDPFNQLVIQVQAAMVLRALSNPDGVLEETIDDYTRRLDASVSTGALYMTEQEVALLTGFDNGTAAAFSVRPLPWWATATPTVPVSIPADSFPFAGGWGWW